MFLVSLKCSSLLRSERWGRQFCSVPPQIVPSARFPSPTSTPFQGLPPDARFNISPHSVLSEDKIASVFLPYSHAPNIVASEFDAKQVEAPEDFTQLPDNRYHSLDILDLFVTRNLPFPTDIFCIHALSSNHDPVFMENALSPNTSIQGCVTTGFLRLSYILRGSKLQTPKLQTTEDMDAVLFRHTEETKCATEGAFQFRLFLRQTRSNLDLVRLKIRKKNKIRNR